MNVNDLPVKKKIVIVLLLILVVFLLGMLWIYPWESDNAPDIVSVDKVEDILSEMSLEEKIYQMFIVTPEQLTNVSKVTAAGSATQNALQKYPVGGIIYSEQNIIDEEQIKEVISNSQSYSKIGLFIAIDEEGGSTSPITQLLGSGEIDCMYRYKNKGTKTAYKNAKTLAANIKSVGFNLDLAPVADVWSNEKNAVAGNETYSDDFSTAAKLVSAAINGFHSEQILCTVKHFPGSGDTSEDEETHLSYLLKEVKTLEREEFMPFKASIKAGTDLIMVGNIVTPSIEESLPASLSEIAVTEILRNKLNFYGLIITDSLNDDSLRGQYSDEEIAVMAVKAGNDILLQPENLDVAAAAIQEAVQEGEITVERIDESVSKILQYKYSYGLLD